MTKKHSLLQYEKYYEQKDHAERFKVFLNEGYSEKYRELFLDQMRNYHAIEEKVTKDICNRIKVTTEMLDYS